ncbi:class I SAM-dependent methyltransferase [Roseivirga sp. E12]|uniref:class I SAM-dependent methyltransferase n=1 Tax=Roseivirga sp. E12 TaxID=2819237 RepID=UPI001ABC4B2A|nr:class I SAM-dependent methyltransferase [Roseivirga sp. E12]MBO3698759.1 methyltransferase domain-containing protein [Roseivirga sp. E12]
MINETLTCCPICHSRELQEHIDVIDHFGDKENFKLCLCKQCQTLITNPRPSIDNIVTYYKSNSYVSHGDKKGGFFNIIYSKVQKINFKRKHSILKKYTLDKQHLDFGCGTGAFLKFLKTKEWSVTGIEPDQKAYNIATKNISSVYQKLDQLPSDQTFSSISLFHVLEHVHDLEHTLKTLISHLDKNGIIILALPNYKSEDAQRYGNHWAGYDVPRHLYHFSQKSVHQLAKTFGLNIVATHPMKFDSYYVSLLSDEYLNKKKSYYKAFINGYLSNRKAVKTNEYSSLIYVLSR